MIHYRPFLNSDPPALTDIWLGRAHERGLAQTMSVGLFDEVVLAKPYFDRHGLIVAVDDKKPVGFVHAGFGPNGEESAICHELGVTCMLLVRPEYRRMGIGSELLQRSERYLTQAGSKVLYGGGIRPLNPFYLGLYGGSELPGILDSDSQAQRRYEMTGYRSISRVVVLRRQLGTFRPVVTRAQLQIRRRMKVALVEDPPTTSWWDACTMGIFYRLRLDLLNRTNGNRVGSVTFWDMEPMSNTWGVRTAGLIGLDVEAPFRRQGMATFLLGEAFRLLYEHGFAVIEVQTMEENAGALALYESLGFDIIDRGSVYRKESP